MNPFVRVEYVCGIILYPEAQCVRGEGDVQYAPLRTPNTQENKLISLIIINVFSFSMFTLDVLKTWFGSFTLHVQLGLGWDVFQNGQDHYIIFNTSNFLYQKGKSDINWITTYNTICTFCHYFPKMVMQERKSFIKTVAKKV